MRSDVGGVNNTAEREADLPHRLGEALTATLKRSLFYLGAHSPIRTLTVCTTHFSL